MPERIDIKLDLYRRIEPHLKPGCIVASSASGLMVKEMQAGWKDPSNFVLGHPFNPPHLIPLVEIIGSRDGVGRRPVVADDFSQRNPGVRVERMIRTSSKGPSSQPASP